MACRLLKLRVTTVGLLSRHPVFTSLKPSNNKFLEFSNGKTQQWSTRTSIRCMASVESSSSSSSSSTMTAVSPLERLRQRQMRDAAKLARANPPKPEAREKEVAPMPVDFSDLGLDEELMTAVKELGLSEPTEVQALGIPAVLAGESVAMASHTGSGKTLAYMIPIVQVLYPCIQTRVHHHCGFFFNLFWILISIQKKSS